jgi:hypothetical protein
VDKSVTSTQWILLSASSSIVMISAIGFRNRRLDTPLTGNETSFSTLPSHVTVNTTLPDTSDSSLNMTYVHATTNNTDTIRTSVCEVSEAISCRRVEFATVLGGLSAVCSLTTALASKSSPAGCVIDLALILFLAWCCGIFFLTFAQGPGFAFRSIYFGSFISLFLCLDILLVSLSQQAAPEREREIASFIFIVNDSQIRVNRKVPRSSKRSPWMISWKCDTRTKSQMVKKHELQR